MSLLEPLRALSPFTQLVMVTGNASLEGAIAAVRGDAFAYVLKPVSPPDLLDTVRRALDQAALYREREHLRVDLERSEERHRELVESMPAFVLALDEAGRITTWNRQLERVTGFSRKREAGRRGRVARRHGRTSARPAAEVGRRAQGALEPGRGVRRRGRRRSSYAVGIDVTDEEEMLRRTAARRAPGGRRHAGRRAGARGPQPAQLGVAAARGAGAAARARRERPDHGAHRAHHQGRD